MRPTLLTLRFGQHELGLHAYGVLVAVGFAVGIWLFWREGRRQGLDGGRLLDLSFWSIVVGLVGSRVAFVALNLREFGDACFGLGADAGGRLSGCTAVLRFWEGGLVFYGGIIATGLVVLLFCRREGWSFWRLGDLAAPTLAIGHVLGRIGCFLAGCCFGKTCPAPFGVSFPMPSVAYQELQAVGVVSAGDARTPTLHATQLYEAAGELAIFGLLLLLRRKWRAGAGGDDRAGGHQDQRGGLLLLTYAACYATLRFLIEMFRGDASRRYVAEWHPAPLASLLRLPADQPLFLSVSQLISLIVLAATVATMAWRRRVPAPVTAPRHG
ncbi:MAG: prolipoprotein diacylglyceryl transferase [Pseudomonadota bacterium]